MAASLIFRLASGALAAAVLAVSPATVVSQAAPAFPLRVEAVTVFGAEAALGSVIAGRLAPSGNVYVVDHVNAQIAAFSPEGRLLWKRGRKGDGPGEFQLPYRLDVRPDGTVLVFDLAKGEITSLSPGGDFLSKLLVPARFSQLDDLVSVSNDEVVAAGVMDLNSPDNRFGLHRFRFAAGGIQYVGSFGPLPRARDPHILAYWGAGSVGLTPGGNILYARRLPYEVYEFDRTGRELRMLHTSVTLDAMPDEFFRVERNADGVTVSSTDSRSQHPGPVLALADGWVLASRVSNGPDFWDLYTPSGEFAGSREIPEEWGGFLGYDAVRRVIWMTGMQNGRPVLFRIRVSRGGGNQPATRR